MVGVHQTLPHVHVCLDDYTSLPEGSSSPQCYGGDSGWARQVLKNNLSRY